LPARFLVIDLPTLRGLPELVDLPAVTADFFDELLVRSARAKSSVLLLAAMRKRLLRMSAGPRIGSRA
jgi:hypothetical protein